MIKAAVSWVVVADGARARVLVHRGPGSGVELHKEMSQDAKRTGEIKADRPGRTFDSDGEGRHAMEPPTDPSRNRKQRFAAEIAHLLADGLVRGEFERLYLVASPQTLGDLRAGLGHEVAKRVEGELAKDYTHLSLKELEEPLGKILVPKRPPAPRPPARHHCSRAAPYGPAGPAGAIDPCGRGS